MLTPGFSIKNDTIWPLQISLSQVGPLYFDVVQPGQTFVRDTGAVWFTIKVALFLDEKDRITNWDVIQPIALAVGGAVIAVATAGAAAFAVGAVASAVASIASGTIALGIKDLSKDSAVSTITAASTLDGAGFSKTAKLVVGGHVIEDGKPISEEAQLAFDNIFHLNNISLSSAGCYAGPPWPFRRDVEPLRITGGPTFRRVPGQDQVELIAGKLKMNTVEPPSAYGTFILQTGTALPYTDASFHYLVAPNRDLFAIKAGGTESGSVEVHVLSNDSGFKQFSLQVGTALKIDDASQWTFALASNRDLVAIRKRGSSTKRTEVHILSAANGYQRFALEVTTPMPETDDNWAFAVASNRDVFAIHRRDNQTNTTEVHILAAHANYQGFAIQTKTALPPTDGRWEFDVAENRDIFAFMKNGTASGTCELHVLAAHATYQGFALQTKTALHEVDNTWALRVAWNRDVFAVRKSGGGSNTTELHVMR